ncbi:feather keratin 3-like [Gallus gallus]|uniref:feather keratin 3-like n=1 Tax=Gallus gallus TaxID=9031 RepID=UPI001AEA30D6|nr:feather keratin 3-like [Gallus gallus]
MTVGLGQCTSSIKGGPSPLSQSSTPLAFISLGTRCPSRHKTCPATTSACHACNAGPVARPRWPTAANESCVRQCQDSNVFIQPSPVVVTLPGPILSSFPQNTAVGSSTSAAVGSILSSEGVPISSGGFGGFGLSGFSSRLCGRRCFPC